MTRFDEAFDRPRQTNGAARNGAVVVPINGNGDDTAYGLKALQSECEVVASADEGTRDDTINRAWFRMGRLIGGQQLTVETARAELASAARLTGQPEHEIQRALRMDSTSAVSAGAQVPREPAEGFGSQVFTVTREEIDPTTGEVNEQDVDFWDARPVLKHIQQFAYARYAAPWAMLGVVLARVITLTPWTVYLPPIIGGKASLNSAFAIVASSGGGKGAAERATEEAFYWPHTPTSRIGSGEAIAHTLKHRLSAREGGGTDWNERGHNMLISMSEVDKLAGQAERQGSTIMPELRAAWSGEALGHITADITRRLPVEAHSYRLALLLGVQPLRAAFLFDDSDGGFPQRIVWLPADDPDAQDVDQTPMPLPFQVPDIRQFADARRPEIVLCDRARQDIINARRANLRGQGDPLDGHRLLVREKVAAALGVLDGRYSINDEDWELSRVVMHMSDLTRVRAQAEIAEKATKAEAGRAQAHARRAVVTAEAVTDAAAKRVCNTIKRHLRKQAEPMSWSALRRCLDSGARGYFEEAVMRLEDAGDITVMGDDTKRVISVTESAR